LVNKKMANFNKMIFGDLNNELYENLPCHAAAANPKLLNENVEMPSLETTAPILLSNEMLYATPLRKSERSNGRSAKSSTTPTKSCGSGEGSGAVTKKIINNQSNGRSATPSQAVKKSTEPGSSQPYFENTSATAGQYYEESRIRDFLKDTSQMIRKMEMHKDLQCSNFSHLARKEHFAHLVQQNVTNSCEAAEKVAKLQINGMLLSSNGQAEGTSNEKDENSVMGSLNSSVLSDRETELNLTGETALESIPPSAPSMADMMLDDSNLKCALNREWVLKKIALCLEQRSFLKKPVPSLPASEFVRNGMETGEGPFFQRAAIASAQQVASSGLPQLGYLVLGANGSGKTSICYDIIEGTSGTRGLLNRRLMAFYLINSQNPDCHSLSQFVRSTILHILSHSSYVIKEDVIPANTSSDSCQEKDEKNEMPDSHALDALETLNDNAPPIEAAESASSFQDKELEEMIISEMKLNQRVAEFCARKNTTNTPLVRQQSEPMPTDAKDIAFTTYTTHPPLSKNQPKEPVAVEPKVAGNLENKTQSEKTSPVKKLTKIPMPIGKNLLKSNSADESRAAIVDSEKIGEQ
jgi:ankyrin repeat domain-containing protein 50